MNKFIITIHRIGLHIRKHSPEILMVAGTVGVVASTVMACKATTKLNGILEEQKKDIDKIHSVVENELIPAEEYTEEDSKKDIAITYANTGVKIVKLYAPSVALGVLSLASILTSNTILRKRNVALAAAYTIVDKSFKEYRNRVIERVGEEFDREIRFNIKAKEIETTVINENGEEEVVKQTVMTANPNELYGEYTKCFDVGNEGWTKDPEYNYQFLITQQNYFDNLLRSRGHVFLNEVFDALGFPRTKMGNIVGWIYDEKNPKHKGDNYIDFGIFRLNDKNAVNFVNGFERSIWLDFNVDGPIIDLI